MDTKLLIATPCYGGMLHQGFAASLLALGTAPFRIEVQFYSDSLVTRARNVLVSKFLESRAENMLFVESDLSIGMRE
jgi:hypothetical protein